MCKKRVYLYAFDDLHRVVDHVWLEDTANVAKDLRNVVSGMLRMSDEIKSVYAVNNREGLAREFYQAVTTKDFTKHYEFEDTVNQEKILAIHR